MKRKSILLKVIALFLFSSFFATASATGYNLNCMTGGHMGVVYTAAEQKVEILFTPATSGTRNSALSHGQCSWVDRKLRNNEPKRICHYNIKDVVVRNKASSYKISSKKAPYIRKIKDSGYFSLRVINDRQRNCMRVLKVNRFDKASTINDNK